jgi:hypothetical protein
VATHWVNSEDSSNVINERCHGHNIEYIVDFQLTWALRPARPRSSVRRTNTAPLRGIFWVQSRGSCSKRSDRLLHVVSSQEGKQATAATSTLIDCLYVFIL